MFRKLILKFTFKYIKKFFQVTHTNIMKRLDVTKTVFTDNTIVRNNIKQIPEYAKLLTDINKNVFFA